jgi:cysteinyl-tRNA synthetase
VSDSGCVTDLEKIQKQILEAMDSDMNTPEALSSTSQVTNAALEGETPSRDELNDFVNFLDKLFGFELASSNDITDDQKDLIRKRESARKEKDWPAADQLRLELEKEGVVINDSPAGSIWLRT